MDNNEHIMSLPRAEYDALMEKVEKTAETLKALADHKNEKIAELKKKLTESYEGIVVVHYPDPYFRLGDRTTTYRLEESSKEFDKILDGLVNKKTIYLKREVTDLHKRFKKNKSTVNMICRSSDFGTRGRAIQEIMELTDG